MNARGTNIKANNPFQNLRWWEICNISLQSNKSIAQITCKHITLHGYRKVKELL